MSVVAVTAIIVIIAASGVLLMRFRKRWLAKINIAFTNQITGLFAGWLPGFGHEGVPLHNGAFVLLCSGSTDFSTKRSFSWKLWNRPPAL
jgi:hypothetical protein